jgi:hypothetical protein
MGAHKFKIGQFENYNPRSKLGSGVCQIAQLVPPAGRQLGIAGANGGHSNVALFYPDRGKPSWRVGRRSLMPCASTNRSISPDSYTG